MCGRFAQSIPLGKLNKIDLYDEFEGVYSADYNIAPSQNALTIINRDGKKILRTMKWGLIPSWTKPGKEGSGLINARFETLTEKPSFKNSYRSRRCIIPASGFFEWQKEGKIKTPYFISCGKGGDGDFEPMLIGGLYDKWTDPDGREIETFTIITTEASGKMKQIHHRMPLVLNAENIKIWLGKGYSHETDSGTVKSFDAEKLMIYRVSEFVNTPSNNSPECIIPAGELYGY